MLSVHVGLKSCINQHVDIYYGSLAYLAHNTRHTIHVVHLSWFKAVGGGGGTVDGVQGTLPHRSDWGTNSCLPSLPLATGLTGVPTPPIPSASYRLN